MRPIIKPSVSKVSEIDRMDLHVQRIALIGAPAVVSDNISSNFSCNSLLFFIIDLRPPPSFLIRLSDNLDLELSSFAHLVIVVLER